MNYCTNCGAKADDEQRFCVSCGKEVSFSSSGGVTLGGTGILKNEATNNDLFGEMESNVQTVEEPQLSPEEYFAIEAEKRAESEGQEREFARAYLQKYNSMSDNYALGFIGALLGGLVGAIPWAIV